MARPQVVPTVSELLAMISMPSFLPESVGLRYVPASCIITSTLRTVVVQSCIVFLDSSVEALCLACLATILTLRVGAPVHAILVPIQFEKVYIPKENLLDWSMRGSKTFHGRQPYFYRFIVCIWPCSFFERHLIHNAILHPSDGDYEN